MNLNKWKTQRPQIHQIGRYCAWKLTIIQGILKGIQNLDVLDGKLLAIVKKGFYKTLLLKPILLLSLLLQEQVSRKRKNAETPHDKEPCGDKTIRPVNHLSE